MEPLQSGGPGLVLECPSLPARTCLGVDSSVQQQRLWKKMGVRGGKVSSFSGRRQRPVTRTGWVRTCLMASSFLGSLSGELAAAEGVCVTDVLVPELGG